jgi:hypothetical protein
MKDGTFYGHNDGAWRAANQQSGYSRQDDTHGHNNIIGRKISRFILSFTVTLSQAPAGQKVNAGLAV